MNELEQLKQFMAISSGNLDLHRNGELQITIGEDTVSFYLAYRKTNTKKLPHERLRLDDDSQFLETPWTSHYRIYKLNGRRISQETLIQYFTPKEEKPISLLEPEKKKKSWFSLLFKD